MTAPFVLPDLDSDLEDQLVFEPGAQSLLQPRVPFVIDLPIHFTPPSEPSAFEDVDMADPAYEGYGFILDHCQAATDRLMEWAKRPNLESLICIHAERWDDLEQQFANLLILRSLSEALGAQLDGLGRNLGFARNGLGDEDYRRHLEAKAMVVSCRGSAEEILRIIRKLDGGADEPSIRWEPQYPAGYHLYFTIAAGDFELAQRWVRQLLRPATDSGVRLWAFFHQRDTRIFSWSVGPYDPLPPFGTGWAEVATPGGAWADVL